MALLKYSRIRDTGDEHESILKMTNKDKLRDLFINTEVIKKLASNTYLECF